MPLASKPGPATYADIQALPPNRVGEIVHGVLHAHPRPRPRHAKATSELGAELIAPFGRGRGGPGGWIILDEPELHLGADVLVPDLVGWRRTRLPRLPDTAYFELAPDWVCEVLSPATARLDRTDKLGLYAAWGVGHCSLVDPEARTLEALTLTGGKWLLEATFKDADAVAAPPFQAHTFDLSVLWPEDAGEPPA